MKTTSYEISKKLQLNIETDFYWVKWNEGSPELVHKSEITPDLIEKVPAYDLETLLEALPKTITIKNKTFAFWMGFSTSSDCYIIGYVHGIERSEFESYSFIDDSLVNTAARLLIILRETGLVERIFQNEKKSITPAEMMEPKTFRVFTLRSGTYISRE